jgi:hypothetical protein
MCHLHHNQPSGYTAQLSLESKDSLDRDETMLAVFIDFKSAYNSVWRVKLMDEV